MKLLTELFCALVLINSQFVFAAPTPLIDDLEKDDLVKIANIKPTTYYIASEEKVACKGSKNQDLKTVEGKFLATVCKRFADILLMEGSGILKDRGHGSIVVNYSKKVNGTARYHELDRCKFGQGIRADLCLLPYHTLAADNRIHKAEEIIYIPAAVGIKLPDGTLHDGTFIVRDTGGAFQGVGAQRIDMFTGTDPDYDNVFQKAGFDKTKSLQAFKVTGSSADRVREKLKEKFGDLF